MSTTSKKIKSIKRSEIIKILLGLVVIIVINIIASFLFFRLDLTSEKKYSLSKPTIEMVKKLDDVVYFKVYLGSNLNPDFNKLKSSVKELLDEFRNYSKSNIQYEFFDIYTVTDKNDIKGMKQQLAEKGIFPYDMRSKRNGELKSQIVYPGVEITYKGRSTALNLIQPLGARLNEPAMINSAIEVLEYEMTNGMRKLQNSIKPNIVFIDGHGELDSLQTRDFEDGLREYYHVDRKAINGQLNALSNIDAVIIAQPDSAFKEKDKFILDQFIMNGGKVLWLLDKVDANDDSLRRKGMTFAIDKNLNLDDLLFKYGVRINNQVVFDGQCAQIPLTRNSQSKNSGQKYDLFPWYFQPLIKSEENHPIVKNLDMIRFNVAGTIDTIANEGVKKTVLLKTSKYTKLLYTPLRMSLDMATMKVKREQFTKAYQPVAVLLEGKFQSEYYNRIPDQIQNDTTIKFKKEVVKNNKMIVVADGDIAANEVFLEKGAFAKLGFDRFTGAYFSNKSFLMNCINYLVGDEELISVRGREMQLRLLDRERITNQKGKWQAINLIVPVLSIFVFGLVYLFIRKRKYTSTS
jgi:ABC-2 type transport system permease protein